LGLRVAAGDADNSQGLIVELKVQSSTNKEASFKQLVKQDIDKLKISMKSQYAKFNRAAIAVAWDPAYKKVLQDLGAAAAYYQKLGDGTVLTVYAWEEGAKVKPSVPGKEVGADMPENKLKKPADQSNLGKQKLTYGR
jgi:hypothetical protein